MKRNKILPLILVLIVGLENVKSDEKGFFTIVGSNLYRFQKNYQVSVVYQGYENEKILELGIISKTGRYSDQPNNTYENFQNITINGEGVQLVDFDVRLLLNILWNSFPSSLIFFQLKDQPEGSFVLKVKSLTGDKFEALQKLHTNSKKFSTFVQTDKSVYKPADNVQFRVFVLDAETKPIDTSKVEIYITDGADNRVKQYDNPKFHKGVFQGELQLSDLPVMGTWHINVKVNGADETKKSFDVAEYVLPKFEVTIDANPDANYKEGKIRATVKAKYTFGKVAKGNATVTAQLDRGYYYWRGHEEQEKKVSKSVDVDGKKIVEFDIEELGIESKGWEQTVKLVATFTEGLSGKEANATTKVTIHETPHKIQLSKSNDKFKPGLPYKITASVRYHDKNAPVTDTQNPIKINVTYYYDIIRMCKRRKYDYPHYRVRFYEKDASATDNNETTTESTEPTTTIPKEVFEEYKCRDEKSFVEEKSLYLKKGVAELPIEMPSNITHINVKVR
jgi:Macroglobulin domain MG3/MG2 domain